MKLRPGFVLELAVNFLLPWLAYRFTLPHLGETGALIASAVPPIVWSLIELARFRRVDALSMMVLAGIVLSVAAMALGGSPRMLLLRESLVSGAVGVVFLLSLPMRRPLIFYLARATVAREMEGGGARFEKLWQERPALVSSMRLMTLVWGVGLTGARPFAGGARRQARRRRFDDQPSDRDAASIRHAGAGRGRRNG